MNIVEIVLTIVVAILFVFSLKKTIDNKGKCACCSHDCPGCNRKQRD